MTATVQEARLRQTVLTRAATGSPLSQRSCARGPKEGQRSGERRD